MALAKNQNRDTMAGEKAQAKARNDRWEARGSTRSSEGNLRKSVQGKGQRYLTVRAAARRGRGW